MTPEEAIEILVAHKDGRLICSVAKLEIAQQIGIKALERHKNRASLTFAGMMQPLPGETED